MVYKSNKVKKFMQSNVNLECILDCFFNKKKKNYKAKLSRYYFLIINSIYTVIR